MRTLEEDTQTHPAGTPPQPQPVKSRLVWIINNDWFKDL